jgi:nitroreductase
VDKLTAVEETVAGRSRAASGSGPGAERGGTPVLIELLRERRSIRKFEDRPVEREKLDLLIEAALRAPSSMGRAPWRFVAVTERETIEKLATAKPHGAAFLKGAPLVIAVCADPQEADVWVEDTSIAALILHLQAHDLGLGSCWVQTRLRDHDERQTAGDYVAGVLDLPAGLTVEAMVGIGYAAESKPGHPAPSLPYDKVSYERYGMRRDVDA